MSDVNAGTDFLYFEPRNLSYNTLIKSDSSSAKCVQDTLSQPL